MLAVKSLFVIEDLVGALAARGNRSISTAVLLDPSLDDRNFLGNLAIGHLVVLSALWSLLAVLALDLNDLGLLFLNFGERRGRGDDLEQLPARTRARANAETSPWVVDSACWAAVSAAADSGFF